MYKNILIILRKIIQPKDINRKIIIDNQTGSKMSLIEFLGEESGEIKNDNIISDIIIEQNNNYIPLKSFKEDLMDCKSSSGESSITNIIKNQFIKEMADRNIISDIKNSDEEYFENNIIEMQNSKNSINFKNLENLHSFSEGEKEPGETEKLIGDFDYIDYNHELSFNLNPNLSFSSEDKNKKTINNIPNKDKICTNNISANNNNQIKKKIFKVVKVSRYKVGKEEKCLKKKRKPRGKNKGRNNDVDWENIPVPKEKHFHLDRKKKRIIFQRKYLKMIYSIVDLEYPFNFNELFDLIKEHVGDKTADKYGNGKSFHIIKINGQLIIVTMKEKKMLLKGVKKEK